VIEAGRHFACRAGFNFHDGQDFARFHGPELGRLVAVGRSPFSHDSAFQRWLASFVDISEFVRRRRCE